GGRPPTPDAAGDAPPEKEEAVGGAEYSDDLPSPPLWAKAERTPEPAPAERGWAVAVRVVVGRVVGRPAVIGVRRWPIVSVQAVAIERAETAGIAVFGIIAGADPAPASAEIALVVDRIRLGAGQATG